MNPALILAAVATVGWNGAELRRLEPNDLLAAAFVAQMSARLDAKFSFSEQAPESAALELWYPPVPAARRTDVARPSSADPRRDTTYDLGLPFFRTKP